MTPALPNCGEIETLKISGLALLRCKLTFKIFELGLIAAQTDIQIFELGLIAGQIGLA